MCETVSFVKRPYVTYPWWFFTRETLKNEPQQLMKKKGKKATKSVEMKHKMVLLADWMLWPFPFYYSLSRTRIRIRFSSLKVLKCTRFSKSITERIFICHKCFKDESFFYVRCSLYELATALAFVKIFPFNFN